VVEKVSDKVYRARLVNPAPGHYEISASGFLTVGGTSCHAPYEPRGFTVLEASTTDAGDADAGED
jgi:hypothetical protein